jgi:hypothetical protein
MSDKDTPDVDEPLPDELLPKLEELQQRQETRGLTDAEQKVVERKIKDTADAVKPIIEACNKMVADVIDEVNIEAVATDLSGIMKDMHDSNDDE